MLAGDACCNVKSMCSDTHKKDKELGAEEGQSREDDTGLPTPLHSDCVKTKGGLEQKVHIKFKQRHQVHIES